MGFGFGLCGLRRRGGLLRLALPDGHPVQSGLHAQHLVRG